MWLATSNRQIRDLWCHESEVLGDAPTDIQLARSPVVDRALADLNLLADVVQFKQRFYRSTGANNEMAKPGTFRLIPTLEGDRSLRSDYRTMRPMFFKDPPPWDAVVSDLAGLEQRINALGTRTGGD